MIQDFIDYLESHVDNGIYVWGAQGQLATESLIDRSKNTDKNKAYAKTLLAERKAEGKNPLAFDCSGLGMYWLQNITGNITHDMSSNGMYNSCEKITRAEVKKGDFVFRYSYTSRKVVHVGYCVDDEQNIIEDKSSKLGVVKGNIDTSSWNRYGRPPAEWFGNEEEENMIPDNATSEQIKSWQIALDVAGFKGDMNPDYYGQWGTKSESATKAFQAIKSVPETGVVDVPTQTAMWDTQTLQNSVLNYENDELTIENIEIKSQNTIITKDLTEVTYDMNVIGDISDKY